MMRHRRGWLFVPTSSDENATQISLWLMNCLRTAQLELSVTKKKWVHGHVYKSRSLSIITSPAVCPGIELQVRLYGLTREQLQLVGSRGTISAMRQSPCKFALWRRCSRLFHGRLTLEVCLYTHTIGMQGAQCMCRHFSFACSGICYPVLNRLRQVNS